MGHEEGFSSSDEPKEKRPLFGRFRNNQQPVQREKVAKPEGADAFLANERVKVVVLQDILQQLKDLNEVVAYVGAAVDALQSALAKDKKEVE